MFKIILSLAAFLATTPVFSAEQYNPAGHPYDGGMGHKQMEMTTPAAKGPNEDTNAKHNASVAELAAIISDIETLRGSDIAEAQLGMSVDFAEVSQKIENIKAALTKVSRNIASAQQPKVLKAISDLEGIRGDQVAAARQGLDADFGQANSAMRAIMADLKTIR